MGKIIQIKQSRDLERFWNCFKIAGVNGKLATFLFFGDGIYLPTNLLSSFESKIRDLMGEFERPFLNDSVSFNLFKNSVGEHAVEIVFEGYRNMFVLDVERICYYGFNDDVTKFLKRKKLKGLRQKKKRFFVSLKKIRRAKNCRVAA